jgi:hypothetical protein
MTKFVSLSTEDRDLGIVEADRAHEAAQSAANQEGATVTVRHPTTDKVIKRVKPTTTKKAKGKVAAKAPAKVARKTTGKGKVARRLPSPPPRRRPPTVPPGSRAVWWWKSSSWPAAPRVSAPPN